LEKGWSPGETRHSILERRMNRLCVAAFVGALFRGLAQCVEGKIDAFAAQPEVTERAFDNPGRQLEPIDQIRRSKDAIAGLPAEVLDSSRGVDGVAEEDDLRLDRPHLAGDHRTAMQRGAEIDGNAEFTPVFARLSGERVKSAEASRYATGLAYPFFELPCRDQFVADVAVDFAAGPDNWVGKIGHKTIEQAVKDERAEPLSQSRRALHVDEQQNPLFQMRLVIAAGDKAQQHVLPEQPVDRHHKDKDERGGEREQHVA